ncbi:MAG: hypothetical protein ACLPWD_05980 [Methanobacterium sp.]
MKKIVKEPWFGKKRIGWGPAPRTWQGWIATLIMLLIVIIDFAYFRRSVITIIIFIVTVVGFLIIAFLTSGNPETNNQN